MTPAQHRERAHAGERHAPTLGQIVAAHATLPRHNGRIHYGALTQLAQEFGLPRHRIRNVVYQALARDRNRERRRFRVHPVRCTYSDGIDQWFESIDRAVKHTGLTRRKIEYALDGHRRRDGSRWETAEPLPLALLSQRQIRKEHYDHHELA